MKRLLLAASLFAACALQGAGPALAQGQAAIQSYPNKPIKVIVPFPAGGPTDGMARIISEPELPTMAEAGFPKIQSTFWLGVVAPGGTPPAIIDKLNTAFRQSLAAPETRVRLKALGADVEIDTPEEFRKMLAEELALWTSVAKAANLQMD